MPTFRRRSSGSRSSMPWRPRATPKERSGSVPEDRDRAAHWKERSRSSPPPTAARTGATSRSRRSIAPCASEASFPTRWASRLRRRRHSCSSPPSTAAATPGATPGGGRNSACSACSRQGVAKEHQQQRREREAVDDLVPLDHRQHLPLVEPAGGNDLLRVVHLPRAHRILGEEQLEPLIAAP